MLWSSTNRSVVFKGYDMLKSWILGVLVLSTPLLGWADSGLLRKASPYSVEETVERFESAVRAKGLRVFPRVDHAAAAEAYELEMPPTVVVGFGNPKYGTPFMLKNPEAGIDFPPRVIVYEDANGKVWLAYNSATYFYEHLFARHGLSYPPGDVENLRKALEVLTDQAVGTGPIGD